MKIFYDENMPFAHEFFHDFDGNNTQVEAFAGRTVSAEQLTDADVLLVRSITKVNESLLSANTNLSFVGTATIGVDHIDQSYLQERAVEFTSSPGCNAISVAEYVVSALVVLAERYLFSIADKTVGIIGAGNTGSRLAEKLTALGINFKLYDPLLVEKDEREFCSFEEILACDVISLHVPLTKEGKHATYQMFDEKLLQKLKPEQILINACRGEVINNQTLLKLKNAGWQTKLVLDVWDGEPNVLEALIPFVEICSAHIAGYSLEGKARGTEMLYQALCRKFNRPCEKRLSDFLPTPNITSVEINQDFNEILLNQLVKMVYDVRRDDALFRQQISTQGFDYIRKSYPVRREFSSVKLNKKDNVSITPLAGLGFRQ